jgi:hypothetical protein
MGTRGRKSAAELTTVGPGGIATARRPEPLADLSDEMAEVWRSIVNGKPGDWFDAGSAPVLAQYCRHVVAARRVGQLIAQAEADGEFLVEHWITLLRAQERQSALVASLATKLRLCQQSRYTASAAATAARSAGTGPRPWET